MSVFTAHMVYFCAYARSEIFQKNARESGVGRGQFHSGVNGLNTAEKKKLVKRKMMSTMNKRCFPLL